MHQPLEGHYFRRTHCLIAGVGLPRSDDCHCQKPHSRDVDIKSGGIDTWRLCALADEERLCESSGNKFRKGVIQIMQRKPCKLVVVFLREYASKGVCRIPPFSQLLRAKPKEKELECWHLSCCLMETVLMDSLNYRDAGVRVCTRTCAGVYTCLHACLSVFSCVAERLVYYCEKLKSLVLLLAFTLSIPI